MTISEDFDRVRSLVKDRRASSEGNRQTLAEKRQELSSFEERDWCGISKARSDAGKLRVGGDLGIGKLRSQVESSRSGLENAIDELGGGSDSRVEAQRTKITGRIEALKATLELPSAEDARTIEGITTQLGVVRDGLRDVDNEMGGLGDMVGDGKFDSIIEGAIEGEIGDELDASMTVGERAQDLIDYVGGENDLLEDCVKRQGTARASFDAKVPEEFLDIVKGGITVDSFEFTDVDLWRFSVNSSVKEGVEQAQSIRDFNLKYNY